MLVVKLPGFELAPPSKVWGVDEYSTYVYKNASKYFNSSEFFVFGHSNGGRIAIKLASSKKPLIKGIILCGSAGLSRPNIVKRHFFFGVAKLGKPIKKTPLDALLRKILYKAARERDYTKTSGMMKKIFQKTISEDLKPITPLINIPTLILWGSNDKITPPKDATFLDKNIKKSKLVVFKNTGHRLPYEKPAELAKEINSWYQKN